MLDGFADDDRTWVHLTFVIEHGDARFASLAALDLGADLADDGEAYTYLELALRSPSPTIAPPGDN